MLDVQEGLIKIELNYFRNYMKRKVRCVSAIKSNLNNYAESTTIPITCAPFLIRFSVSQARINLSHKMRYYSTYS